MKFLTRESTSDANIFRSINDPQINEYRLPDKFKGTETIVDIGMHIGSFSYACLSRGAKIVVGFEAWKENFELACQNLSQFNNGFQVESAVWRSDQEDTTVYFNGATDVKNTGGGNVIFQTEGVPVQTVSLDNIIDLYGPIDLLKIDCEGSEFPILFTCTELDKVKNIHGEYHEMGGAYNPLCGIPPTSQVGDYKEYTIKELTEFLESKGFKVESYRHGSSNLGMFFATR